MSFNRAVREDTASILQHTQAADKERYLVIIQVTQTKKRTMSYTCSLYAQLG